LSQFDEDGESAAGFPLSAQFKRIENCQDTGDSFQAMLRHDKILDPSF
jgi:hypothetical protein